MNEFITLIQIASTMGKRVWQSSQEATFLYLFQAKKYPHDLSLITEVILGLAGALTTSTENVMK